MLGYYFTFRYSFRKITHFSQFSNSTNVVNSQILSDLFGISCNEANLYVDKHKLQHKDGELLAQSVELCRSFGYQNMDILNTPNLLTVHPLELIQHYKALHEGGFNDITPHVLAKARTYMRRLIIQLKAKNLIPYSTNVPEMLISYIEDKNIAERVRKNYRNKKIWNDIHLEVLKNFLRIRLNGTKDEIDNLIRIHKFVRNKSFRVIQENIKVAQSLGFEPRKIIKYGYLLASCPSYAETTLRDLGNIAGIDMKRAMRLYPKLMITPPRNIIKTYGILKQFDIPDETIRQQPNVFHMAPQTVRVRLQEIENSPDLKLLLQHPKILALVVHHNRANDRLSFLQQSQIRCVPLTILKTNVNNEYEEYLKEGKDVHKKSDVLEYLKKIFSIKKNDIKEKISRHPYYLQVPLKDMQETYDYLVSNSFTSCSIYKVIYILLYPVTKVRNIHDQLKSDINYNYKSLSQANKLNLMVYLMEKEHHFTGNGIWEKDKMPDHIEKLG
ncbi:unnamed protein product [Psylliodes chrysocephalus]|uniref:Transcription termination factor 5, mitochondrial n=1 Tax=Psylliodes chrysocephalus TaxID=3402493 RepID=A0A9P0CRL2_9CUCU|nr:unnamed protein product [Psylliodes chrysocephala]